MNRSQFLKRIGLGIVVGIVAPKVLISETPVKPSGKLDPKAFRRMYPMTYKECYPPEEILRLWRRSGNLIYKMKPNLNYINDSWLRMQNAIEKAKS